MPKAQRTHGIEYFDSITAIELQLLCIVISKHSLDYIQSRYNWIIAEINVLQLWLN